MEELIIIIINYLIPTIVSYSNISRLLGELAADTLLFVILVFQHPCAIINNISWVMKI